MNQKIILCGYRAAGTQRRGETGSSRTGTGCPANDAQLLPLRREGCLREDKYLQTVVGTIVRINERTASIDPGDGTKSRVGFARLRHVLDV